MPRTVFIGVLFVAVSVPIAVYLGNTYHVSPSGELGSLSELQTSETGYYYIPIATIHGSILGMVLEPLGYSFSVYQTVVLFVTSATLFVLASRVTSSWFGGALSGV